MKINMMVGSRILLYMDILGTKERTDIGGSERIKNLIDKFTASQQEEEIEINKIDESSTRIYSQPAISNFSDHILMSFDLQKYDTRSNMSPEVFNCMLFKGLINVSIQFHSLCLKEGFLMRGVITQGELYHKGSSVLGKALIEAVNLEEKTAVYPRVIISNKVSAELIKMGNLLERDFDGIYFVNYLKFILFVDSNLDFATIRDIIEKNLKKFNDELHQLAKWHWLAIKFNGVLDFFIENDGFDGWEKKEAAKRTKKFMLS